MLLFSLLATAFAASDREVALRVATSHDLLWAIYDRVGLSMAREMLVAASFALENKCTDPGDRLGPPSSEEIQELSKMALKREKYRSETFTEALRENHEEVLFTELNTRLDSREARIAKVHAVAAVVGLECGEKRVRMNRRRKCYAAESTVFVERTPGSDDVTDVVATEMWEVKTGSRVLSRSAESGELFFDEVWLNTPNHRYRAPETRTCSGMRRVTFGEESNEFHVTASHGLFTKSGEVKPAGDLVLGDEIHTAQGWERVVSNSPIPGDRLVSTLYTAKGQYLVGAPGVFNATRAAVGTNLAVMSIAKLVESPFFHTSARHLRSLAGEGADWHFHEYWADMAAWYLPKDNEGSAAFWAVTILFLAPFTAFYLATLPAFGGGVAAVCVGVAVFKSLKRGKKLE